VTYWRVPVGLVLLLAAGCGGGPTSPNPGQTTNPGGPAPSPGNHAVTGVLVSATDDTPVTAPVSFTVASTLLGLSSANGTFTIGFPATGANRTILSAAGFVDRQTDIGAPGADLRLSLIPSSFDIAAFDQMFRHASVSGQPNGLTRWRTPPRLVLERRVVQFTLPVCQSSYVATDEEIGAADVDRILRDTQDGYDLLTAGRVGPLAGVETQFSGVDAPVATRQSGRILLMRAKGLQSPQNNYWGYACWSVTADGEVTGGFIVVDRDFDLSVNPSLRQYHRSLWMHELGHTLGCQHVTGRDSVMNSNARLQPSTFDLQAARIATLRPTGNRPPDIDPVSQTATSLARVTPSLTWHGAH
jgi:hypothetical protein